MKIQILYLWNFSGLCSAGFFMFVLFCVLGRGGGYKGGLGCIYLFCDKHGQCLAVNETTIKLVVNNFVEFHTHRVITFNINSFSRLVVFYIANYVN